MFEIAIVMEQFHVKCINNIYCYVNWIAGKHLTLTRTCKRIVYGWIISI